MVTAGKPNKGGEVEGWSDVTGAGGREGEAEVCFKDTTGVENDVFSEHKLQVCLDEQTKLQVAAWEKRPHQMEYYRETRLLGEVQNVC